MPDGTVCAKPTTALALMSARRERGLGNARAFVRSVRVVSDLNIFAEGLEVAVDSCTGLDGDRELLLYAISCEHVTVSTARERVHQTSLAVS